MTDYLITGTSGAVGAHLLRAVLAKPDARAFCTFRQETSLERLKASVAGVDWSRVRPLHVDLRTKAAVAGLRDILDGTPRPLTVIHAAADVSWTKPAEALDAINVEATLHLASLAASLRRKPSFVYFSTAYVDRGGGSFLNGYEASKAAAEALLLREFSAKLRIGIVRPTLIVGDSASGWIYRFNGLYPLVKVMAFADVPCLVGNPAYRIDMVPVDWVVQDALEAAERLNGGRDLDRVTTAAGAHALSLEALTRLIRDRLQRFFHGAGMEPPPLLSIITSRQFDFLLRAARSWELEARFEQVRRISDTMRGYIAHAGDQADIAPDTQRSVGDYGAMIARSIDYWLDRHAHRLLRPRRLSWDVDETHSSEGRRP